MAVEEIEVTEKMITAGADELDLDTAQNLLEGFTDRRTVAECVFRAMLRASCATKTVSDDSPKCRL